MRKISRNNIVYFKHDVLKHPYLIHDVFKEEVTLGKKDNPNEEQEESVPMSKLSFFENVDLLEALDTMSYLISKNHGKVLSSSAQGSKR